jgi:hypothetical protein
MGAAGMANQEQLEILRQGVEKWNEWRSQYPDQMIDLSEAVLIGAKLSGADLSSAALIGADLSGANLHGANLGLAYPCRAFDLHSPRYSDCPRIALCCDRVYATKLRITDAGRPPSAQSSGVC